MSGPSRIETLMAIRPRRLSTRLLVGVSSRKIARIIRGPSIFRAPWCKHKVRQKTCRQSPQRFGSVGRTDQRSISFPRSRPNASCSGKREKRMPAHRRGRVFLHLSKLLAFVQHVAGLIEASADRSMPRANRLHRSPARQRLKIQLTSIGSRAANGSSPRSIS
jgi:hypothetical protein